MRLLLVFISLVLCFVNCKLQLHIIHPPLTDNSPRFFNEKYSVDMVVGAAVTGADGPITVEITSNGKILQGTNAYVFSHTNSSVWLMFYDVQQLAGRQFEADEEWEGEVSFRVEAIMEYPKDIAVKDYKIKLRHLPTLVLESASVLPYSSLPMFTTQAEISSSGEKKKKKKLSWWVGYPGAQEFQWPVADSTKSTILLDLRAPGIDLYLASLQPHGDWIVEEGDPISGTELHMEAARLQRGREEQYLAIASEEIRLRYEKAREDAEYIREYDRNKPTAYHRILEEMSHRLRLERTPLGHNAAARKKKMPKRRLVKTRPSIPRAAVCIAGLIRASTDETSISFIQSRILNVFAKETELDVFLVAVTDDNEDAEEVAELLQAVDTKIISPDLVMPEWENLIKQHPKPDDVSPKDHRDKVLNILRRMNTMKQCVNIRKQYEREHPGTQYSMVVRMRPDLYFPDEAPLLSSFNRAAVSISGRHSWAGINDRFLVSPIEFADTFDSAIDTVGEIFKYTPPRSNYNGYLMIHALQNGTPIVRRFDFWYCRLRGSTPKFELEVDDCPFELAHDLNERAKFT